MKDKKLEEKINLDEAEKVEGAATNIVEKIIDNMTTKNSLSLLSLKEIRKIQIEELEKRLEALPEGHYKREQLIAKIAEKKKHWFPNTIWNSQKQGTYRKSKPIKKLVEETKEKSNK